MTSIITAGSSPALTPIATASAVAAIAVAERKLLASFMVCAMPGFSPMTNTVPNTASASLTASIVGLRAGHHHGQRALGGAADAAGHRAVDLHDVLLRERGGDLGRDARAGGGQVDQALDALAVDDAAFAERDLLRHLQRRQARHHGLDPVGDVWRRRGELGAERDQRRDRVVAGVVDDELVAGLDEPPRHRRAHVAQPDETDVHDDVPSRVLEGGDFA